MMDKNDLARVGRVSMVSILFPLLLPTNGIFPIPLTKTENTTETMDTMDTMDNTDIHDGKMREKTYQNSYIGGI
jgi:hypothetical protein